jgi:integrase
LGRLDLPYVSSFRDIRGKMRYRFRRGGVSVYLPGTPGSAVFLDAYQKLLEDFEPQRRAPDGTLDALAQIYFASPAFLKNKASTQRAYRSNLRAFLDKWGDAPVGLLETDDLAEIIGLMADRPGAANNLIKRLRALFKIARRKGWVSFDPTEDIPYFKTGEIHTWNAGEHAAFVRHHQPGTMARLAYMAHLHTGQRKGDIVRLPMPKKASEPIRLVQEKTGKRLEIPLAPALWQEIKRHTRRPSLLVTSFGKPFTANGYGNWFRERCREAELPERCSSHGLRKSAAKDLAEAGCSAHEIQAITGHGTLKEVERYTRAAEQSRLAKSALAKRRENKPLANTGKPLSNSREK